MIMFKKLFVTALALCLLFSTMYTPVFAAASDATRLELESYIQNVANADGKVYRATDSAGHSMDCLKIIPNPSVPGQYIGVYHCYFNGGTTAYVCLATSTNLLNWTFVRTLAGAGGANATQPTIYAVGTAFMMAWEQEPNNHVKLAYYNSWTDLQNGSSAHSYDCPRQLSSYAEGTPNIYSATATSADIGFHYWQNGTVDRQARGTMTNWNSWSSSAQTQIDNAMLYWGVGGNIGDRDNINYNGYSFNFHEAGGDNSNFGSWRVFLYDFQTGNADKLSIRTDAGSLAFANPTIAQMTVNGQQAIVCTLFIPSENSQGSESGELIYYKYIGTGVNKLYSATGSQLYHNVGRAESDGWSANTAADSAGHMIYGPYATDIPGGRREVIFKMLEDNNTANNDTVVILDVYDATAGQVLTSASVTRMQFLKANCWDVFNLSFNNTAGHSLEFRVWWTDKSYIKVNYIAVN